MAKTLTLSEIDRERDRILAQIRDPKTTQTQAIGLQAELTNLLAEKGDIESDNSTTLTNAGRAAEEEWRERRRLADQAHQKHQQRHQRHQSAIQQSAGGQGAGLATALATAGASLINEAVDAYHERKHERNYRRDLADHGRRWGKPGEDPKARRGLERTQRKHYGTKNKTYAKLDAG